MAVWRVTCSHVTLCFHACLDQIYASGDKALLLRARALNFPADESRSFHYLFGAQTIPKTTQGFRALLQESVSASNLPKTRQRRV